jgi:uncharacterized protein
MLSSFDILLSLGFFLAALLYSSVGHAGASAYLALMAFANFPALMMRPTALVLNIVVASLGSYRFIKAKLFDFKLFLPFMLGSLPFAYLGGKLTLAPEIYRPLVGLILIYSALRMLFPKSIPASLSVKQPPLILSLLCGAVIGFLSGLTGTGGGIFLSPLILFLGWSPAPIVSGIAISFILGTSVAGLLGNVSQLSALPPALPAYIVAVIAGAFIGTHFGIGAKRDLLLKILSVVLMIAGGKLIWT